MTQQENRNILANMLITESSWTDSEWSNITGISRQTFWRIRKNNNKGIESKTIDIMAKALGKEIDWVDHTKKTGAIKTEIETENITSRKGGALMGLQERLIANQLDQIDELTKQNAVLQNKVKSRMNLSINDYVKELDSSSTFKEIAEDLNIKSLQWDYVFDNIQQPLSVSRKGILRSVNKYLLNQFGYKKLDMVGKPIIDFIHPDEKEECIQAIKENKRNRVWRILKSNGHYCEVKIKAQSFGNADNRFNLALMICVDEGCPNHD